ncbi:MAG TPA: DUF58 domain-containing protein [Gemmatimonadota bacterium]|nr:DUF58 domain-containing protein [Gemmatimonadota bacterium]
MTAAEVARPPARGPAGLLPPEELLRLGSLELIARLVVEGYLAGRHRSPGLGGSLEFAEHRPYVPGDDLRRVDWKVFGRTDRWYLRESEQETNLRATLVLDASASMGFASAGRVTKWAWGRALAAALAWLLLAQQDAVGLAVFDDGIRTFVPPRGGRAQKARLFAALEAEEAAGGTSPEGPFRELAERLPRRGLLVLVSDLLGPPERFLPGLRYFRHRKHEVVVFHVLDPAERSLGILPAGGEIVDIETGRTLRARPEELARGYREELDALERRYRDQAHDRGFDWVATTSDEPIAAVLGRYLAARRHRV